MSGWLHDRGDGPTRLFDISQGCARRSPDAPALVAGNITLTYMDLVKAIDKTKTALADLGVRAGDRVMILSENGIGLAILVFSVTALDAWAVVVNARLSEREINEIQGHCRPRRILYTVDASSEAARHAQSAGARQMRIGPFSTVAFGTIQDCEVEPVFPEAERQVAALIYTTGTTGKPKGVMLTHGNLLYIAHMSSRLRGLTADDHVYGVLPISHVYGLSSTFLGTMCAGACLELIPRFDAAHLVDALRWRVTVFQGVPAMFARLLEYVDANHITLETAKLRYLSAGGAPLDVDLKRRVQEKLGKLLNNGYGLTECSPTVTQTRIETPRDDDSVGRPLPGLEIRIVGTDGRDVESGDVGELWVRGPNVMAGYYRDEKATSEVVSDDGWLRTGDLARAGANDHYYIVGRVKDLIIRSGFNVYPVEVEGVLNSHPAITFSAVVGRHVPGNEEIVAFVQMAPGSTVTEKEVRMFAARRLAAYKVPSKVVRLEEFPAGPTGKVLKRKLFEMAAAMADG